MAGSYRFVAARAVKCEGLFCFDIPLGGREKDKRKRIVNRKKEKVTNRLVSNGEEVSKELLVS